MAGKWTPRTPKATTEAILTGQQEQVIAALCEGQTQAAAAVAAGVTAETVSRWKASDALFLATLNTRKQELWDAHAQRLTALRSKALDVVEAELGKGAPPDAQHWAAALVLKAMPAQERPNEPTSLNAVQLAQMFDSVTS